MWEHARRLYRCQHEDRMGIPGPGRAGPAPIDVEGVDAMGRGRQKAKQTKVARQLKYFSPDTDYTALERELHGQSANPDDRTDGFGDDLDDDDPVDADEYDSTEDDGVGDEWVAQGDSRR
jgi:hypothetical protein